MARRRRFAASQNAWQTFQSAPTFLKGIRMTRYALTVLLCLSPMAAMADGNELLSGCQKIINAQDTQKWVSPDDSYVGGSCLGVVRTVASLGRELPADLRSCTPPGIPTTQAVRVIVKW